MQLSAGLLALSVALALSAAPPPQRIVFDTDMGNDIDDALALAIIHALENQGEARLLAVTLTKDNWQSAVYCDLVNHFYNRPRIPVGKVKDGKTPEDSPMVRVPAQRRDPAGALVYPRRLERPADVPDAVTVLRNTLAAEPDQSVVIVQVGFSTNLARLLDARGARDLIARKVKLLSVMAGAFPDGKPEYNVHTDLASAQKVFAEWPTPIVASGFEIGNAILYPARSIDNDFNYVRYHPIADAYRNYQKMPYDRPTWDLTSVLYAVRPDAGYFSLSPPGWIRVAADGRTRLEPAPDGRHRYLTVNQQQKARILEEFVKLAAQPPRPLR